MGQIWERSPYGLDETLKKLTQLDPNYSKALGSFFTYFGYGKSDGTRDGLLKVGETWDALALNGSKTYGLVNAAVAAKMQTPTLVVYSNDFSTNETVVSNPDVTNVTQFANLALQAGAFQIANQNAKTKGSILFNPDAIGAMAKNFIANGVSINERLEEAGVIVVKDAIKDGKIFTKTVFDFKEILTQAVNRVWELKDDPAYKNWVFFPKDKPIPDQVSNGIQGIQFAGDISDYAAAQAWMIKQFSPNITLSTVTNLWAGNPSAAALKTTGYDPVKAAATAAEAFKTLGWDKVTPYLDFMTFDKYERDETSAGVRLGERGGGAYDFNQAAWQNALKFYNALTEKIMPSSKQGIMLWQIPASSLPTDDDPAMLAQGGGTTVTQPHFGLTKSFFFGDPKLAEKGLAQSVSNLPVDNEGAGKGMVSPGTTYGQVVKGPNGDWLTVPGIIDPATGKADPLLDKVFAILWGGGDTSTPISYRASQWTSLGDASVAAVALTSDSLRDGRAFNVKNDAGATNQTAVLSIMKDLADYRSKAGQLVTPAGEKNVVKDLLATSKLVIVPTAETAAASGDHGTDDGSTALTATSTTQVTITLKDYGTDSVSFGYFAIDPETLTIAEPGTGRTLAPGDSGFAKAALDSAVANGLVNDPGFMKDDKVYTINLDPSKTYAFLIRNGADVVTSIAQANADGLCHVGVDAETNTISFEDRLGGGDFDYNDLVVSLVGAVFQDR